MPAINTPNHFLRLSDLDSSALNRVLQDALRLKRDNFRQPVAAGKVMGLLFLNPSLRTRLSFETLALHIGAAATIIQPGQGTWTFETRMGAVMDADRTEHLKEAIQVIGAYSDLIGVRAFAGMHDLDEDLQDRLLNQIASYATVPVINMESAREHPCQALADGLTLLEQFNGVPAGKKFVLSWAPHPKPLPMAVPHSALEIAARLGMQVTLACPPEMVPDGRIIDQVASQATLAGGALTIEHDQQAAFDGADVVYGKSWAGPVVYTHPEHEQQLRTQTYANWTITPETMAHTRQAAFMHCLPVRRNVVVTDEVLDGPAAIHIRQAENRLHAQKALVMRMWNLL